MFVVGIAKLAGALQDELPALAADLGITAYDARMLLAPGIPALVLVTPEKSKALGLLGSLRARGHESLAFDTQAVVSSHNQPAAARGSSRPLRSVAPRASTADVQRPSGVDPWHTGG